jgi:hypothetical protein
MRPTIIPLLRVFFAAGTCLPNRCLATKGGIHFTESLPNNDTRDTHIDTQTNEGFVKYAVEMGSVAMLHIPSFIKTGSGIKKLI